MIWSSDPRKIIWYHISSYLKSESCVLAPRIVKFAFCSALLLYLRRKPLRVWDNSIESIHSMKLERTKLDLVTTLCLLRFMQFLFCIWDLRAFWTSLLSLSRYRLCTSCSYSFHPLFACYAPSKVKTYFHKSFNCVSSYDH